MSTKTDPKLIKELRDQTQAPIGKCKEALDASGGDLQQAKEWLKERAMVYAAKKSDRTTGNGAVVLAFSPDQTKAALLVMKCETDFVAKTESFSNFAVGIAQHLAENSPEGKLDQVTLGNIQLSGSTVADIVKQQVGVMGENIVAHSASIIHLQPGEFFNSYVHNTYVAKVSGRIGGVVRLKSDDNSAATIQKLARDLVVHIVVSGPDFISIEDAAKAGVPESEHADKVLFCQKYAMDGSTKIPDLIAAAGHSAQVTGFIFASIDRE